MVMLAKREKELWNIGNWGGRGKTQQCFTSTQKPFVRKLLREYKRLELATEKRNTKYTDKRGAKTVAEEDQILGEMLLPDWYNATGKSQNDVSMDDIVQLGAPSSVPLGQLMNEEDILVNGEGEDVIWDYLPLGWTSPPKIKKTEAKKFFHVMQSFPLVLKNCYKDISKFVWKTLLTLSSLQRLRDIGIEIEKRVGKDREFEKKFETYKYYINRILNG